MTDTIKAFDLEADAEISGNMAEIGKRILQNSSIEPYRCVKPFSIKITGLPETYNIKSVS
jgi:hypothetical protein